VNTLMEENRSKYNTDPLDPEYAARRTEEMRGLRTGEAQSPNNPAEAPTRHFYEPPTAYPSVYAQPTHQSPSPPQQQREPFAPSAFHPSASSSQHTQTPPTSRPVKGISLPENAALALPYVPFFIGAAIAAIELFLVPRTETRTRFHAAQALALHLAVTAAGFILRIVYSVASGAFGGVSSKMVWLFWSLFSLATTIYFIVCLVRAWKGENRVIEPLADLTRWLNEKIEPRK